MANSIDALREDATERLRSLAGSARVDPMANGVRGLAVALSNRLEAGDLGVHDLRRLAKAVSDDALVARATRFAEAHHRSATDWRALVDAAYAAAAGDTPRRKLDAIGRTRAGVVFTAHPTFAMSRAMRDALAAFASGSVGQADFRAILEALPHAPDGGIALRDEHDEAVHALENAQGAVRLLLGALFDKAREVDPGGWTAYAPAPVSVATWVGYDLDGRTDIHWAETFRIRLAEKSRQLRRYAEALAQIGVLDALGRRLARAADRAAEQASMFAGDLDDPAAVVAAANALSAQTPDRLVSLDDAVSALDEAARSTSDAAIARGLCVLRAEMRLYGLGLGRIHLRINAAQVRSTLRADLGLGDGQGFLDRTALDAAAERAGAAAARRVNFASVFLEKMTARRQLMLCAQFLKHVDADTPIRFLIAECEAPATVMGAIYLARLYGVADQVDVSPLFETPEALERGGRLMERLLEEPAFLDYARRRGRVAIQLGFSDSGRFMGQIAADLAIERLQILLARSLADASATDIEAVVFNTHGESMGRGGFPGSLEERFDHLMTPWARTSYAMRGISLNAECSFQGGDGFLHFATPGLADATLAALFGWSTAPTDGRNDRFYKDINFSWDVYRAVKGWQEALFANRDYQAAIGAFGVDLLVPTGSRRVRRQSGASMDDAARSLRAIPHNAILQQLAAPANVFGGFGFAAAREPERFAALLAGSERMGRLATMAMRARNLTSLAVLRAYGSLLDPSFWTIRARHSASEARADVYSRIADRLSERPRDVAFNRLANLLSVDRRKFDRMTRRDGPVESAAFPEDLYLLHACRMALMMQAFALVASLPSFSARHEVSLDSLIDAVAGLRLSEVADTIARIFPVSSDVAAALSAIEEPADDADAAHGYPEIHERHVEPLREIDAALKEIVVGISHSYGAFG